MCAAKYNQAVGHPKNSICGSLFGPSPGGGLSKDEQGTFSSCVATLAAAFASLAPLAGGARYVPSFAHVDVRWKRRLHILGPRGHLALAAPPFLRSFFYHFAGELPLQFFYVVVSSLLHRSASRGRMLRIVVVAGSGRIVSCCEGAAYAMHPDELERGELLRRSVKMLRCR